MKDDLRHCSYLVVDDDDFTCQAIANVLSNIGCTRVFAACDAEEAFNIADKKRPDFVLLDIYMPETDGWTLLQRMRQVTPDSVFVMVTSSTQLDDLNESVELRADGYCIKPVVPYSFSDILKKARNNRMK
jgi:CheY-like chemotaxis protein